MIDSDDLLNLLQFFDAGAAVVFAVSGSLVSSRLDSTGRYRSFASRPGKSDGRANRKIPEARIGIRLIGSLCRCLPDATRVDRHDNDAAGDLITKRTPGGLGLPGSGRLIARRARPNRWLQ